MRDRNSGFRSLGVWLVAGLFLGLAFTAGAVSGGDNAAWVSYSGVPSTMEPDETATVTVTMRNTGTTTWRTKVETETSNSQLTITSNTLSLASIGDDWDVSGVAVSGSVAPNATHSFEFTIAAPATEGSYTFRWRMSRDTVVTSVPFGPRAATSFGARTPSRTIVVESERDTAPSFDGTIPDQVWLRGEQIEPVTLPGATGGNGALSYSLVTCYLPGGVTYDRAGKRISGTPRTAWGPTPCTWKVTDSDDNTAASDADTLTFTIWVKRPVLTLSAMSLTVVEGGTGTFTVMPATQPMGTVTVRVTSRDTGAATVRPGSLSFTPNDYGTAQTVIVTGVHDPGFDDESTTIVLNASGGGYNNVSASVTVTVDDDDIDTEPSFGSKKIQNQSWERGSTIAETLPAATGGNAPLTYSLSPSPPRGVGFNDSTRMLSGTPTATQELRGTTRTR